MTARSCALVVDAGAGLVEGSLNGVAVVPLRMQIGADDFVDDGRVDAYPGFYDRLRGGGTVTTSTPAPGEYLDAFRRSHAESVLCLTIPARWSGMFDAACLAATLLAGEEGRQRVTVMDTGTAAGGLALLARFASGVCAEGRSAEEVIRLVGAAASDVRTYGALATLTYVARSGRVPALLAGVSNSLHVRPVFRLFGGETGRVALTRTASGAVTALQRAAVEHLNGDPQWLLVFHADAEADANALSVQLRNSTRVARSEIVPLSPVAGAYTGPGTIGFAALPLPQELIGTNVSPSV